MSNLSPSTAANRYYLARMEAAKGNEVLCSRDMASERTGIDRKRLQRIEIGTLDPYPEEVMLMADEYHAPELCNYHCTHSCPIGRRMVPVADLYELDRLCVRFLHAVEGMRGKGEMLLAIAEDGKLSPEEMPSLLEIVEAANKVSAVGYALRIYLEKHGGR